MTRPIHMDQELERRLREVQEGEQKKASLKARIFKERLILLPCLALVLAAFPNFRVAQVQGRSMQPLYYEDDKLLLLRTYKYFSPLQAGDVVVVKLDKDHGKYGGEEFVKRVVFIQNAEGNAVWPETITNARGTYPSHYLFPREVRGFTPVPKGKIMVLGDNVNNSTDSRDVEVGPIDPSEIVGKVIKRWPKK